MPQDDLQITSTRNPRVKVLRSLRLQKYRQRERCFLIEGIRIVEEAWTCGAPVETLVYAWKRGALDWNLPHRQRYRRVVAPPAGEEAA